MIIKRSGHGESTEQVKPTERTESKEDAELKANEQNLQKDNRNTVKVKHSKFELVN